MKSRKVCRFFASNSENVSIVWWKYCLIWTLEKCVVLFANNFLKMSALFDVSSGKYIVFFGSNSLEMSVLCHVWKSVVSFGSNSVSVSYVWYELWKCIYSCLLVTLWKFEYCLIWTLKKCLLSLVVTVWKYEYFFVFLVKCFITVWFRFSCMYPVFILLGLHLNALGESKPFHVLGRPISLGDLIPSKS